MMMVALIFIFLTNSKKNERQSQSIANYDVDVFYLDDVLQFMADYIENAMPRTRPLRAIFDRQSR